MVRLPGAKPVFTTLVSPPATTEVYAFEPACGKRRRVVDPVNFVKPPRLVPKCFPQSRR
jgi:hypothetical protein